MEENETPNQAELTRNDQLTPDIPLLDWSDFYATIRPGIPDELSASLQLDSPEADDKNLYEGFRIQIYSGPSPSMADTVAKIFRTWSTQYISGYSPKPIHFSKLHTIEFILEIFMIVQKLMRYLKSLNANFQMHGLYMIGLYLGTFPRILCLSVLNEKSKGKTQYSSFYSYIQLAILYFNSLYISASIHES